MFLKHKAIDFEKRDKSRTYLVFGDDKTLLGYYTLSLKALPFGNLVSKNAIKEIDGFSRTAKAAGVILIGQLGKDKELAKHISGTDLLGLCFETVYEAYEIIGSRFV
ncbi:MAG: hypothetical protein LBI54_07920, partial [Lachnospiraceae bacterium]|nr:hypothetical protein [Lachnospiraceae bacterium]